jgi:hypothetical protein
MLLILVRCVQASGIPRSGAGGALQAETTSGSIDNGDNTTTLLCNSPAYQGPLICALRLTV